MTNAVWAIEELRLVIYRCSGWTKVEEEGRCRMCLRPWSVRKPSRHHIVPQAWFRRRALGSSLRDCDANIVPLCRPCHDFVENDMTGRRQLRKLLGSNEVTLSLRLRGQFWFDIYYPPTRKGKAPA